MDVKSRIIFLSAIGLAMGIFAGVVPVAIIATIDAADGNIYLSAPGFVRFIGDPLVAFVVQALIFGLYGILCFGGTIVYSLESWSIVKATVTHFCLSVGTYFPIAFFLRWFSTDDVVECVIFFFMMCVAYVIIWLIQYLRSRAYVNEINRELELFKKKELHNSVV